jgi:hypothetical protein
MGQSATSPFLVLPVDGSFDKRVNMRAGAIVVARAKSSYTVPGTNKGTDFGASSSESRLASED